MPFFIGLLSSVSLFSSAVLSISTPQSIGSDLSIITHNDLYGNSTTRRAAVIALDTKYTYSSATSKCAALGTILWNPDSYSQDLTFLRYLDFGKVTDEVGVYWIKGNSTLHCRAITTYGEFHRYPCDTLLPALCSNTATDETRQIAATTNNATIIGRRLKKDSAFRFLGIRYASIPARFSHSEYAACGSVGTATCSEDCLNLNIWTPYLPNGKAGPGKSKAVLVWIHGGGFTGGAGSDTTFDGSALASRGDVVVVTINYRLSTLGFLALENTPLTGNYGLEDQNQALDWIRAHIGDFGGDRHRITIFGQSAGAASVRALLASPRAREKVSGAIMMSTPQGLGYASTFSEYLTVAEATNRTGAILGETGCFNTDEELLSCLRKVDAKELIGFRKSSQYPVIDNHFLTRSSLPLGRTAPNLNTTLLTGIMRDDGSPFTSRPQSTNLTLELTAQGFPTHAILSSPLFALPNSTANTSAAIFNLTSRIATDAMFRCLGQSTASTAAKNNIFTNVFAYEFDRAYQIAEWSPNPPACEAPATPAHPFGDPDAPSYKCHSGELYAVFGTTISQGRAPRDDADIPFSQYVVDAWASFARTGHPDPQAAFLEARGFKNTSRVLEGGAWSAVGERSGRDVRVLGGRGGMEGWREEGECGVLGMGRGYWDF
ncbi:alpha/beta-hydrolase [Pyrenochaeta sp. DS3sAY3a]|nr:alpha/beta-hydrolase [Pyrenochaeta sp. DS3sAY3a]